MLKLVNSMTVREFAPGETLFDYGDVSDCLYIVLAGTVDLHLPNPELKPYHLQLNDLQFERTSLNIKIADLRQMPDLVPEAVTNQLDLLEKVEHSIEKLNRKMDELGRLTYTMSYSSGDSFGEVSMHHPCATR